MVRGMFCSAILFLSKYPCMLNVVEVSPRTLSPLPRGIRDTVFSSGIAQWDLPLCGPAPFFGISPKEILSTFIPLGSCNALSALLAFRLIFIVSPPFLSNIAV